MDHFAIIGGKKQYSNMIAKELRNLGKKVDILHWTNFFPLSHKLDLPNYDLIYLRIAGTFSVRFVLVTQLELMGYRLINNPRSIFITNNKFLGCSVVKEVIKVPPTFLVSRRENLKEVPSKINFPFVLKPIISIGGKGVIKIGNQEQLEEYYKKVDPRRIKKRPVYAQEFVDFDRLVRVIMVGDEVIDAAYDKLEEGDWKCSVCVNPNVKPYPIDKKLRNLALRVKSVTKQEICMLDIFEKDGEYTFNEINNQCDLSYMQQATGINHAGKIAEYLIKEAAKKHNDKRYRNS